MSLFWLAYRQEGATCVLILEAASLISARLKASLQFDIDAHFERGIELPQTQKVPATAIGRMLTQAQAEALLKTLERQIPKKAAAASVKRATKTQKGRASSHRRGQV